MAGRMLEVMWRSGACLGLLLAPLPAAETKQQDALIPKGKGEITVSVDSFTLKVFTYRPKTYSPAKGPLLVVFHGHGRNPDSYRDHAVCAGRRVPRIGRGGVLR